MAKRAYGYDEWNSDACAKGGDGICDGFIPAEETNTGHGYSGMECACACHDFDDESHDMTTKDYAEFHRELWRD